MKKKKRKSEKDKLWFPSLHQISQNIDSHSWFNILYKHNNDFNKKMEVKCETSYLASKKYKIYPTKDQQNILIKWLDSCVDVYNLTNQYIKSKIFINDKLDIDTI